MKRYILLLLILILLLVSCQKNGILNNEELKYDDYSFEAIILEINENSILVQPNENSNEYKSSDKIIVKVNNTDNFDSYKIYDTIKITYNGIILESYPAQISAYNIEKINNIYIDDKFVEYNGIKYNKAELSDKTLEWLNLSENEKILSSYYPIEFISFENSIPEWGITLSTNNVTPTGLKLMFTQKDGTNINELTTGTDFYIEKLINGKWIKVEYINDNIAWNLLAYVIAPNDTTYLDVNWEWLYGELSPGHYRLTKHITNFKSPEESEEKTIYGYFEIIN